MTTNSSKTETPAERATALLLEYQLMQPKRSWRVLERKYGVPNGTLSRFAKSRGAYVPKKYARRLGFSLQAMRLAPACPKCGDVHLAKRVTHRKPLPEWVTRAVDFLQQRDLTPVRPRVYGRGGREAKA